jgi:formylglycine-generating enzyme required for sulfatase activity
MFPLLNCCVEAAVNRLGKFIVCLVPGGSALIEVVEFGTDVWERWKKQKPAEEDRREELRALAHASAERVAAAVQAAIQAEAAGQPAAVKRKLTTYLIQMQVAVRRTLCRPADREGRSADLRLNNAEDLLPFLPPELPRFEPSELDPPPVAGRPQASGATPIRFACPVCMTAMKAPAQNAGQKLNCPTCGQRIQIPLPPRGTILAVSLPPQEEPILERHRPRRPGVPGWVWLAGGVAAVVVAVVVALTLRGGPNPTLPDGPPIAVNGPGDADKPKDPDAEQKKNKDKTDTPEKPVPLPRLVAFPKLSLPERGAADLQVKVEREGYTGPIKLQVENLPPGVTCQRLATIPAGESALRLEFRTDGTPAEGTATVEVIATADTRVADRQKLSLVVLKSAVSVKPPEPLPKSFKNAMGMEFVLVPKGKSWLGGGAGKSGDREVEFKQDFYLGKYEVTQEEWQTVMGGNPGWYSRSGPGKDAVQGVSDEELKRFPVENVSWDDAQLFLAELNKRAKESGWVYCLPTETEWEYACRGGPLSDKQASAFDYYLAKPTNSLFPGQANFYRDGGLKRTCKVGSYPPNSLGIYDMHGNVWEWCHDAQINRESLRITRGGSHTATVEGCIASNRPDLPTAARRYGLTSDTGLRVARVPIGAEKK